MLSIFPLTDRVILCICVPVLTVISVGWIVCIMTMDTSQQPDVSIPKGSTQGEKIYHNSDKHIYYVFVI